MSRRERKGVDLTETLARPCGFSVVTHVYGVPSCLQELAFALLLAKRLHQGEESAVPKPWQEQSAELAVQAAVTGAFAVPWLLPMAPDKESTESLRPKASLSERPRGVARKVRFGGQWV